MNSGSREFDFNTMADVGKQVSENKKALDDVRSSFVGPTQEEDAPEPTPVVLDGPATEEGDDNKVNLNELAYAAKRHLEEVGHPAADMLMTPANIKKLAEFENKRQRVERERLAYEEDPEGYDLNSANALDAYVKSWNLKNLTPEQRTGTSTWKPGAADEATPPAGNAEVSRAAANLVGGQELLGFRQDAGGSSGGEAPAPASPTPKGASKTNNGITTGPAAPVMEKVDKVTMSRPGAKVVEGPPMVSSSKKFTPLPNQPIAEALSVPKAQRVKEYENPNTDGIVPLSTMGKAVDMMGGDFMRGAKGLAGMASNAVDTILHPYGKEGEDNRKLAAAKAKKKKQTPSNKIASAPKKETKKKG